MISSPELLPPGLEATPMGAREYGLRQPGLRERVRVATDPTYYEQNADSMELSSPATRLFRRQRMQSGGQTKT